MWKPFNKKADLVKREKEEESKKKSTTPSKSSASSKKKEETKKPVANKSAVTGLSERPFQVFLRPLVSEKSAHMGSSDMYTFVVRRSTNKVEIKKAFAEMYSVNPLKVRIVNMPAQAKQYGRTRGTKGAWKKAIVRVPKGTKIDVFEGV